MDNTETPSPAADTRQPEKVRGPELALASGSGFLKRRQRLYISENNMGAEPPPCLHEEYDPDAGATYLQISRMPVHRTREFRGLVLIDTDARGQLRGLEFVGDGPLDCPNNSYQPTPGNGAAKQGEHPK